MGSTILAASGLTAKDQDHDDHMLTRAEELLLKHEDDELVRKTLGEITAKIGVA
jgi:hypothetical protein